VRWAALLAAGVCLAQEGLVDRAAERARREFEVPGIAVAVVKDGRVVLSKGYGVRRLGEAAPVTPLTGFGIASNTKAFTAAALAMLVDEGKLAWDDPVIRHLPAFQMYDPYVTREMTVRDLLVHRSGLGLGAGDLMFWPPSDLSREDVIRRLRFIKPATSFRSRYAYDNILYLVAGQIVPAVTGKSWDDFIRERIFVPLVMRHSNTSLKQYRPGDNWATPHARVEGKVRAIEPHGIDNNGPAASINSCVADLARWMLLQLNQGELDGRRLFSARQSYIMWSPQTVIPQEPPREADVLRPHFLTYGLGWTVSDYRGHKLVHHTGGLAGYVSRTVLVPDLKLGMVVLTNQEAGGAYQSIVYSVLDDYLRAPATDWAAEFVRRAHRREADAESTVAKAAAKRNAGSRPSLALSAYAGRYRDAWYGDVVVESRDQGLVMRFTHTPELTGDLRHWQYDTFVVRWRNRALFADAYVTFSLKPDGAIDQVKMAPVSPLTDFSYDFQDLLLTPVAASVPAYD